MSSLGREAGRDRVDHSIVIPTRNHPGRLRTCLASILEARSGSWDYEVLVMDNSDPDVRTSIACVAAACADPRVRYISMVGVGLMAARHGGVEAARGDIVSFIDDDELLVPSWFEGVQACLRDPGVALVTGPFVPHFEARPPGWLEYLWDDGEYGRSLGYLTLLDCGDVERDVDPMMVWGGNLTIRRRVFEDVRGSHPDYLPSPWEAFQGDGEVGLTVKVGAAGHRARYSPDCAVLHAVPEDRMTFEYFRRRAWFIGLHTSFTETRRRCGLGARFGVPDRPVSPQRPLTRRAAERVRDAASAGVEHVRRTSRVVSARDRMAADIRRRLAEARREGHLWHQDRLASMPGLLEYVCRRDFLGENARLPGQTDPGGAGKA